jgi:cytochrome c553
VILARLVAAALLAAAPGVAAAQSAARGGEPAPAARGGEPAPAARGADLAAERCAACHGEAGRSRQEGIPSLAGQGAEFITLQMILFREGLRQVPAMTASAQGLSERDIEDLAAFFASLPPGPPEDRRARDPDLYERGRALSARMNCGVCHLGDYRGRNQVPRLAGQREEFLARTMAEYRDGRRVGADTQMNGAVFGASDSDLAALAHYLAQRD